MESITDASERWSLRKIMNNCNCRNVCRYYCFTFEKPTSDNHSIRKTSNVKKRKANFSTEENVTSPKTTETVYVVERDVDTDALMQK